MSDVCCPYCGNGQEICHDDGQGYEEDQKHEQECNDCGKYFKFTTSISYSYDVFCEDESHHVMNTNEYVDDLYECENCDHYEIRR